MPPRRSLRSRLGSAVPVDGLAPLVHATLTSMSDDLLAAARAAEGFMPDDEGRALYAAARDVPVDGPLLEVGSYLGKSTLYLAAAARERKGVVVTVDHHRGSEEHQPGWEYHDPSLVDGVTGRIDTLPGFRRTIASAGAEDVVVAVVARGETLADTEMGAVTDRQLSSVRARFAR